MTNARQSTTPAITAVANTTVAQAGARSSSTLLSLAQHLHRQQLAMLEVHPQLNVRWQHLKVQA